MSDSRSNFVVVANRLPVTRDDDGQWQRAPGGLVSAVAPVVRDRGGTWVGWTGKPDDAPARFSTDGMDLVPVNLSDEDKKLYYEGFSNRTLWPLCHYKPVRPEYASERWNSYHKVNQRFADEVLKVAAPDATVWIHDYQLQLVPQMLREQQPSLTIGFFLHIPFPPDELFGDLPQRQEVLEGLLGADLLGFQRAKDAENFRASCRMFTAAEVGDQALEYQKRPIHVGAYPISIDVEEITNLASSPDVHRRTEQIRNNGGRKILFGVDRLDYTKGIPERVEAIEKLLDEGAINPDEVEFIQVAETSREDIPAYQNEAIEVDRRVEGIKETYERVIDYQTEGVDRPELVALMRAADVMVVTSLRDGMNLVAMEYVAARRGLDGGALVLSEFTGAATVLDGAHLVNPNDDVALPQTILTALQTDRAQATDLMDRMREYITTHDVRWWSGKFLGDLDGAATARAARTMLPGLAPATGITPPASTPGIAKPPAADRTAEKGTRQAGDG